MQHLGSCLVGMAASCSSCRRRRYTFKHSDSPLLMLKKTAPHRFGPQKGLFHFEDPRRASQTMMRAIAAAALGAAAAVPALAATSFYLVVPLPIRMQAVDPITVNLTGATLPSAKVDQAYSENLHPYLLVTGDSAYDSTVVSWSVVAGVLPAGLALDASTGIVAGTPTAATSAPATFTVRATYKGQNGQADYSIEVALNIVVTLAGAELPKATINKAYSQTLHPYLTVTGDPAYDPAAVRWSLTESVLPAGLTLNNTTGVVAGTPTTPIEAATFQVVAVYKDAEGRAVYTLKVADLAFDALQIATMNSRTTDSATCVLLKDTKVNCWGTNTYGQLGIGNTTASSTPKLVSNLTDVKSIVGGGYGFCALLNTGAVKCWGYGAWGNIGDGGWNNRTTPAAVTGISTAVELTGGLNHFCARLSDTSVKCWGLNSNGQLGDSTTASKASPVSVLQVGSGTAPLTGVTAISAGWDHTCATMANGTATCWGMNNFNKLGDNSGSQSLRPVAVKSLTGVQKLMTGANHNCAILTGGGLQCWGANDQGQLGLGHKTSVNTPTAVTVPGGVVDLDASELFTCAVTSAGAVYCWGGNGNGQLGDGTRIGKTSPVRAIASGASQITIGYSTSCSLGTDGGVKCWGVGQGVGPLGGSNTPVVVKPAS